MGLIIKSFVLSFGVFGRMFFPIFAIVVVSSFLWSLLNIISGGLAGYLSGPITAAFISLLGIRAALAHMGDHRRTAYETLILYSVLYGVFFLVAKSSALFLADLMAVFYAEWQLGADISVRNLLKAERSLQIAFTIHALSGKAIASLVLYTTVFVVMAVPLAGAARAAGQTTPSVAFFKGFGRSFVPLFCVFAVSFFLQFFFELFTFIFAILPLFVSVITIIFYQHIPDLDLEVILKALAASGGLLWLHSWIWAASVLALVKTDGEAVRPKGAAVGEAATDLDLRALRKSRE